MDIRDFEEWLSFKPNCKNRIEENCKLKENGLCIYILCPLVKFDREIDNLVLQLVVSNKNNGEKEDKE
ncbi:MAG: hypothetical protein OdinLCB4_006260 [Candidatus Odinarchaeum yellowstonii]|uniref:Uncharacterized protein n=1 Tax=Odinarchaeota yellowstonii (strain LCB_4) TaxID=1841599 RepID=A0AAF0D1S8_ODILC|nr:MAG: hypothetical protein OdinLCB4_006260 [Candidatus Odinarchaeum yellowstonii]